MVEIVWGIHDQENIWWDSRNVEIVDCRYEDVASMSWQAMSHHHHDQHFMSWPVTMQQQFMFLVVSDSSLGQAFPNYRCYSTTPTDNVDSPFDLLRIKQALPFQLVDVTVINSKIIRKLKKIHLRNHRQSCLSHRKFFSIFPFFWLLSYTCIKLLWFDICHV